MLLYCIRLKVDARLVEIYHAVHILVAMNWLVLSAPTKHNKEKILNHIKKKRESFKTMHALSPAKAECRRFVPILTQLVRMLLFYCIRLKIDARLMEICHVVHILVVINFLVLSAPTKHNKKRF